MKARQRHFAKGRATGAKVALATAIATSLGVVAVQVEAAGATAKQGCSRRRSSPWVLRGRWRGVLASGI